VAQLQHAAFLARLDQLALTPCQSVAEQDHHRVVVTALALWPPPLPFHCRALLGRFLALARTREGEEAMEPRKQLAQAYSETGRGFAERAQAPATGESTIGPSNGSINARVTNQKRSDVTPAFCAKEH
jgi:hypothetical protein